jgi:hypothetical protein
MVVLNLGSGCLWAERRHCITRVEHCKVRRSKGLPWNNVYRFGFRNARKRPTCHGKFPWLQYYLAAGSFLFFGENTFTTRLPFALAWPLWSERDFFFCRPVAEANRMVNGRNPFPESIMKVLPHKPIFWRERITPRQTEMKSFSVTSTRLS